MESFKRDDAASYNAVAASFDRFTEIVTRPLAETMVALAGLLPHDRVLDLATGSGIVALSAASHLTSGGWIAGIDLSDGLLATAGRNVAAASFEARIHLARGDAEALPFANRSFDVLLLLFALLHFPHPWKALAEMHRVLKPGGRLVIGIGSAPPWNSVRGWTHRLQRIPDVIRLATGKLLLAPSYLERLVERYIPAATEPEETDLAKNRATRGIQVTRLVHDAGFRDIRTHWQGNQLILNTAEDFWDLQSAFSSIARKRLKRATSAQMESVRTTFKDDCERVLAKGGQLVYHNAAAYVFGTRR